MVHTGTDGHPGYPATNLARYPGLHCAHAAYMLVRQGEEWRAHGGGEAVKFGVNVSILFKEVPCLKRSARAYEPGFGAVASW